MPVIGPADTCRGRYASPVVMAQLPNMYLTHRSRAAYGGCNPGGPHSSPAAAGRYRRGGTTMRKRALLPVALVTTVAAAALLGLTGAVALAGKARAVRGA